MSGSGNGSCAHRAVVAAPDRVTLRSLRLYGSDAFNRLLKSLGCSKIVSSSHPQNALRRRSRPAPPKHVWLRRPGATPHERAFEDEGLMAAFQQPLIGGGGAGTPRGGTDPAQAGAGTGGQKDRKGCGEDTETPASRFPRNWLMSCRGGLSVPWGGGASTCCSTVKPGGSSFIWA